MALDKRTEPQDEIVGNYIEENPMKATFVLSTGFGKSRVAMELITKLSPSHIHIFVNSADLRDFSWKREFKKWGKGSMFENYVTILTYQKLAKMLHYPVGKDDIVFLDEVDFMADTDVLSRSIKFFGPEIRTVGLTGFITETKLDWFKDNLPIFATYTAEKAQDKGILNKLHFIFVKYDLSINKDVEVKYKKFGEVKTFMQSENSAYDYQQKKYISLIVAKEQVTKKYSNNEISYNTYERAMQDYDYKISYAIKNRSELLLNCKATATIAKKLLAHINATTPKSKTIVFSKRTKQSEIVCGIDNVYNGTIGAKIAKLHFKQFEEGEINVLGTCDKINRGVNIDNLDTALFETFYGSNTEAVQRFGRLMRLDPDSVATVYVLLPHYMREDKNKLYSSQPTQQVTWAQSMLRSTNVTSSVVWDYRTSK